MNLTLSTLCHHNTIILKDRQILYYNITVFCYRNVGPNILSVTGPEAPFIRTRVKRNVRKSLNILF